MARQLKSDLLRLQEVFSKNHDRFRVLKASIDELVCRFILKNKTFFDIQANISHSYPSKPPLWLVMSEDATITELLETPLDTFNNSEGRCNKIIDQVVLMVQLLCRIYDEPLPHELDHLSSSNSIVENDTATGGTSKESENADEDEDEELECEDYDDDDMFKMEATDSSSSTPTESEMDAKNAAILKKQQKLQFDKPSTSSCTRVLMKEFDTIYRSEMFKNKTYSVDLIDDSLNVWNVNVMSVCPDSLLQTDLNRLKEQGLSGNIVMRITFEDTFPYSPPFIQITYPAIQGGHVLDHGALCMELLTTQGWSSAYSMEKVLLRSPYSHEKAKKLFNMHADMHKRHGWDAPAQAPAREPTSPAPPLPARVPASPAQAPPRPARKK